MDIGEDEDDLELSLSLARARKALLDKKKVQHLDVAKVISEREAAVKVEDEEEDLKSKSGGMVFTTTMEFCRNLQSQEKKRYNNAQLSSGSRNQETEEQVVSSGRKGAVKETPSGTWESKDMNVAKDEMEEDESEGEDAQGAEKWKAALNSDDEDGAPQAAPAGGALDKEALASGSMADALRLMRQKGYKKETTQMAGRVNDERNVNENTPHWADKINDQQMRSLGIKSKEIVISRLDEFGREMTTKEAWRHLNHNFHGKKPGARKVEKRRRQYEEEVRLKKLNAGEQAEEQMKKVHTLQEKAGSSHVVLSAGGSMIQTTSQLLRK